MTISVNQSIPGYFDQANYYIASAVHQVCADVVRKNELVGKLLSFPIQLLCEASVFLTIPLNLIERIALSALNSFGLVCKQKGLLKDLFLLGLTYCVTMINHNHQESATTANINFNKISCRRNCTRNHVEIYNGIESDLDLLPLSRQNFFYPQVLTIIRDPEYPVCGFAALIHQEALPHRERIRQEEVLRQTNNNITFYQREAQARHTLQKIALLEPEISRLSPHRQLQLYIELAAVHPRSFSEVEQRLHNEVAAL